MTKQTKEFKTEVKQLLDLVIHSLYSNKDIFLREIISNASDALDKARFESLTNKEIESENFRVRIELDKQNKAIIISDNGIGMSIDEVEANIGTIARSGTKAFMQQLKEKGQSGELIGQFGVGFYSAFMVADRVKLITRKAGASTPAVVWESEGTGEYSIETAEKSTQGTDITIYLKDEFEEFLNEWRIQSVVRKFSDYIEYPVILVKEETTDDKTEIKEEIVNSQKAIWTRSKSEISSEDYAEFYRHISHDFAEPQKTIHWNVEGNTEFKALVFIPSQQPMDMLMPERKKGLHLYVKRVFITDECQALLPEYLRFIKGVVDSSDLPLNVSREILQEDRLIRVIEKNIVKKVLDTLKDMKESSLEEYLKFWKNFGRILKEGMHFDFGNKEKIQELMLFETLNNADGKLISLKEYVDAMPESQDAIYVITGSSRDVAMNSPHLESLRAHGYDVLFMIDSIDPWVLQALPEYAGKKLKNISKGEFELGSAEEKEVVKKELEVAGEKFATLLALVKKLLEEDVKEVKLSSRLTDSAACLVADENGIDANMERILAAMGQEVPKSKRILELNPSHPLLVKMNEMAQADITNVCIGEYANLLFDLALLTEGTAPRKPLELAKKISELMIKA